MPVQSRHLPHFTAVQKQRQTISLHQVYSHHLIATTIKNIMLLKLAEKIRKGTDGSAQLFHFINKNSYVFHLVNKVNLWWVSTGYSTTSDIRMKTSFSGSCDSSFFSVNFATEISVYYCYRVITYYWAHVTVMCLRVKYSYTGFFYFFSIYTAVYPVLAKLDQYLTTVSARSRSFRV